MGFASAKRAIEERLLAGWTDDNVACRTPIAIENVKGLLTKVNGTIGLKEPPHDAAWVRCTIREGTRNRRDLNRDAPLRRTLGLIVVQIFVPRGTGTQAAKAYGDQVAAVFDEQQFSGISTRAGEPREIGDTEHWWQYNVTFPYYRDEIGS